ncbi:MAG: hypothetical protein IT536_10110 [Hyphomicrobiales bacterium]|nr:hypothetical protein [Hyphomicrobiales bacterium]
MALKSRRAAPWLVGLAALTIAGSAASQGNIDAGKTPAQIFADTCSNCHRRASDLKRGASAGFLRQHYTPGAQEAAAMAAYLAALPVAPEPRGGKAKAPPEKDKAKVQQAQGPQGKTPPKGKRPGENAKAPEPEPPPPEPVREEAVVPKLEPFEE